MTNILREVHCTVNYIVPKRTLYHDVHFMEKYNVRRTLYVYNLRDVHLTEAYILRVVNCSVSYIVRDVHHMRRTLYETYIV